MFKKLTASMLAAAVVSSVLPMCLSSAFAEGEEVQATVEERSISFDTDTVIRESIPQQMWGYNFEDSHDEGGLQAGLTALSRGGSFLIDNDAEPGNNKPIANKDAVKNLEGYPMCHFRFGGGSRTWTFWKETLGPYYSHDIVVDRTFNNLAKYTGWTNNLTAVAGRQHNRNYLASYTKKKFGDIDMVKGMLEYDKNASFTVCLNVLTESIENLTDEIEFLTSDGTYNYNGGENWGKVRKEMYGLDPVNVFAWELGNENDLAGCTIDEYVEIIKKVVPAIRSVDKTTPIAVHIATSDQGSVGVDFQRQLLIEVGDIVDYYVIHKYFTFNAVTAVCEPTLRKFIDDVEKFGDPERHKILFTEYNTGWIANASDWCKNASISSTVTLADYWIRMLNYPQLIEADFHAINGGGGSREATNGYNADGGPWWAYYCDTDNQVKPTAPIEAMKVLRDASMDAKMIDTDMERFELGVGSSATAVSLLHPNGDVSIFATNFYEFNELKLNLENAGYYLKESTDIYGTVGKYSMNFKDHSEVEIEKKAYSTMEECKSYTMKPMSISLITLSPIK